jgi:hypothetical protein
VNYDPYPPHIYPAGLERRRVESILWLKGRKRGRREEEKLEE